jgi:hypothetical protein
VSVGRREFSAAGAWLTSAGGRRGRVSARTATNTSLLAARDRTGTTTRSAMRAEAAPPAVPTATTTTPSVAPKASPTVKPPAAPVQTTTSAAPAPKAAPEPAAPPSTPEPEVDTMARLREAKRRARER